MLISRLPPSLKIIQSQLEGTWAVIHFYSTFSLSCFISEFILASCNFNSILFFSRTCASFKGSLLLSALVFYIVDWSCKITLDVRAGKTLRDYLVYLPHFYGRLPSRWALTLQFYEAYLCWQHDGLLCFPRGGRLQGKILRNVSALPDAEGSVG